MIVERDKQAVSRCPSHEGVVDHDEVVALCQGRQRSMAKLLKRSCLPLDLDAGMGLAEMICRGEHRREATIVFPGDSSERLHIQDRNELMHPRAASLWSVACRHLKGYG
jgi:hypothetical protein